MSTARKLPLGPLHKAESTKFTFSCPTSLKSELECYAALHRQTYGEAVDGVTLIPQMLEAFMAGGSRIQEKMGQGKQSSSRRSLAIN